MIELAPSILAADLLRMGKDVDAMVENGITLLHYDVMDAHFVPNLSFGPALCKVIHKAYPQLRLDVHLMMDNPEKYLAVFADAGATTITLHQEVLPDPAKAMADIKNLGVRCGLSVKPKTQAETLLPYLDMLHHILIMTVEPGFGGQKFMPEQMEKIRLLRHAGFRGDIGVDGGVGPDNAAQIVEAGANILVMGTSYFGAKDPAAVAQAVRNLA